MCTASHNPKAYTGAKLVERGAVALSGDGGIGDISACSRRASATRRAGARAEDVDVYAEFQDAALGFIDPSAVRPLKVVLDGGNGMAGPMVGPVLERLDGLELVRTYWEPDGEFPDHEPNPLLPENRAFIIAQGALGGRRPRHRLGRRRRPLLLHRRDGRVRPRRLPHRAAGRVDPRRSTRAPTSSTTSAPRGRSPTPSRRRAAARSSTASATRSSRPACATRRGVFGGEVSGHYYFADFYNADSGTIPALLILELLGQKGATLSRAARALHLALLHLGRDQLRGRRPAGEDRPDQGALRRRRPARARRHLDRLRRLALQRAPLQHRAAAAPDPRVAGLRSEDMEAKRDEVLGLIRS